VRKNADKEQVFGISDGPNQMHKGLRNSLNSKAIQPTLPYRIGVVVANLEIAVNWDAFKVESLKGDSMEIPFMLLF
jgi:hypothetical protein